MIKVIENTKPWEVMKAHEEGKRVAYRVAPIHRALLWAELDGGLSQIIEVMSKGGQIAIINESQPELTAEWWERFDWGFFNQYGGLKVVNSITKCTRTLIVARDGNIDIELCQSPFYPWLGGKCPVPDNVEVELTFRQAFAPHGTYRAGDKELSWEHEQAGSDIIAFRLTGRVL